MAKRACRPPTAQDKLNAVGLDEICARIESGDTQRELAIDIGVDVGTLNRWLGSTEEYIQQSARARSLSAEAWLDRGLECIASALHKDAGIDASAARAYAQECARRAAVRNPAYRDKVEVDAKVSGEINLITRTIIDA